jgi:hypothetical protein
MLRNGVDLDAMGAAGQHDADSRPSGDGEQPLPKPPELPHLRVRGGLGARIVAVADTYDAMTSTRAYRRALTHDVAAEELRRCQGGQFDPEVVECFLEEMNRRRTDRMIALAKEAAARDEVAPEYYALQQLGAAPEDPASQEIGKIRE